ncbi:SAM-dependent methyltransferase [Actinomycetospora cinnamomea]|uniref:S-adenosyl methyltransferase n=1 Tax=Actinomycetospora cinnamomea TaxID=663609 RepID=A0A2U1FB72_9PSEU|nr:SAM-dependent methyltransferase [Actinomycetospora cinnamomea]PVZ09418.1 S-adenosyl methyltransferase [Actinomycetospora cinnamomea]
MREEPPELAGPTPNGARIFDHFLGGTDHLVVDCEFADEIDRVVSGMGRLCHDLRRFSRTVVRHLAESGVDQFLELGSGLPTVDPVHAVAARHVTAPRVVYVDRDAEAVALASRIAAGVPGVAVEHADLTDVDAVLATPGVRELVDLRRPVAVLAVGVLSALDDETARATLRRYRDAVAPGSALAVTHPTGRGRPELVAWRAIPHTGWSYAPALRDPEDMAAWLEGTELVGPGWTSAPEWALDDPAADPEVTGSGLWGVLARVRRVRG